VGSGVGLNIYQLIKLNNKTMSNTKKAVNIVYDTDGEEVSLPSEMELPDDADEETAADYVSDKTGWLVKSLDII
jgi:hypothetical protein